MRKKHNGIAIRSKIWIETGGMPVFGRGRRFLLEAIKRHGSINQAARDQHLPVPRWMFTGRKGRARYPLWPD